MNDAEALYLIKDFINRAKKEQQYYDQRAVKDIEDFIHDTTLESIRDLFQKAVSLELEALVKKGKIEKVIKSGRAYYRKL